MTSFSLWSIFKARGGQNLGQNRKCQPQKQFRKQLVDQDWDIVEICGFFILKPIQKRIILCQEKYAYSYIRHARSIYTQVTQMTTLKSWRQSYSNILPLPPPPYYL